MKMNKLKTIVALVSVCFLAGCSTTNSGFRRPDLSKVSVGMTKAEVIAALGKPDNTATQGQREYLEYGWDSPWDGKIGVAEWYFVRLMDGRVESFGHKGDFDSTKNPAVDVNVQQRVTTESKVTPSDDTRLDLFTKLKKLQALKDEGLITTEEYERLRRKAVEEAK